MKLCIACGSAYESSLQECSRCGWKVPVRNGFPSFIPESADYEENYNSAFFRILAEIEPASFWFCSRNELILWFLKQYFPSMKSFLELGCGTGFVLSAVEDSFPSIRIYGGDTHSEGLAIAAERTRRAELMLVDAVDIPYADEFDVIGAFDVIEHIMDDGTALREMCQALRGGGGLLLTVPAHQALWSRADELAGHKRRYTGESLRKTVQEAGFEVLRLSAFVSLLSPLILLSRFRRNRFRDETDLAGELRTGRGLNFLLGAVMDMERTIMKTGVNLPFGGSLILAARKV